MLLFFFLQTIFVTSVFCAVEFLKGVADGRTGVGGIGWDGLFSNEEGGFMQERYLDDETIRQKAVSCIFLLLLLFTRSVFTCAHGLAYTFGFACNLCHHQTPLFLYICTQPPRLLCIKKTP